MSAIAVKPDHKYTAEEYFALLDRSEDRYEYHDGAIRMMAGGTIDHSRIKSDVARVLGNAVLDGPCEPLDSDMAVRIKAYNSFVLPDLSFLCEEPKFDENDTRKLLNPSLLIEVISETSEAYDRGEKFQKYRSLASFREYMLIDSRRYSVECWYKEEEKIWRIDAGFSLEESVYLHTLGVDLPLTEIYRRVRF